MDAEIDSLKSEIGEVKTLLEAIPEENVIERYSFRQRLGVVEDRLRRAIERRGGRGPDTPFFASKVQDDTDYSISILLGGGRDDGVDVSPMTGSAFRD